MRRPTEASIPQRVSIVLPTRDRVGLLRSAIRSVQSQTWPDIEILVVDDASTDATPDLLEDVAADDARVRFLRLERPSGAAVARNHAIARARGEFVAFQDDDCIWAPEKIERQVRALERAGTAVGFAYCGAESVEVDGSIRTVGIGSAADKFRGPWMAGTYVVMVRREALLRTGGFDEHLPRLQDFDLWIRILAGTGYVYLPEVLVRTVRVPGGISTRRPALAEAGRHLRGKYRDDGILSIGERAQLHHALGHKLMVDGFWLAGIRNFIDAVRIDPGVARSWLALGAAMTGVPGYRLAASWRETRLVRRISTAEHRRGVGDLRPGEGLEAR